MESPRRRLSARLTYANVMSTIAVFAVLGGTGYAAVALPNASVGKAQLKANSVDSSKVINGSLVKADFRAGQLLKGATGAKGATGPPGAVGVAGAKGDNFTLATTLPSGQTERGQYSAWGSGVGYIGATFAYRIPLAAAIAVANVHFLALPPVFTPACPAIGQAAAGNLCVYEDSFANRTFGAIYTADNGINIGGSGKDAFNIWFSSSAGAWSYGEYAVTAP